MDRLKIKGGIPLHGTVELSGSKNAALPILFAAILSNKKTTLERVPNLSDIETTVKLLKLVGCNVEWNKTNNSMTIDASRITSIEAPYDLVRTMRASILILAPLLAKMGEAKVSLPGGCAIGARPVDFHIEALKKFGVEFNLENGYVHGTTKNGLCAATVELPFPSVGATETALIAAASANGKSLIKNAAHEPEIIDLGNFLTKLGATITGLGTSEITVLGTNQHQSVVHEIIPDRIEAATYWIAGVITGGSVSAVIERNFVESVLEILNKCGATIIEKNNVISVTAPKSILPVSIETSPFPGFPTDVQAQMMALLTQAQGVSTIKENIFENRFMHVPELQRLGANLKTHGNIVEVHGPCSLQGAVVMATDLRASASLVIAGLAAKGQTIIRRIYHLDRGYEVMEKKLSRLGANIVRELEK